MKTKMISSLLPVKIIASCSWSIAAFLSLKISHNHSVDASQKAFLFKASDLSHQLSEGFSF
jgi:hypothetical protein